MQTRQDGDPDVEPTETALIVAVPEAEQAVGRFRATLDRAAGWGVPPHVTVMYPFLPPARIDQQVLDALARIIEAVPRFHFSLTRVEWFGDAVIWLAPQPDRPFKKLTGAVWQRFPENPPYAGVYTGVVPHLTIGHDAPKSVLEEAAEAVSRQLPIHASADAVRLIAGSSEPNSWRTLHEFPLGS